MSYASLRRFSAPGYAVWKNQEYMSWNVSLFIPLRVVVQLTLHGPHIPMAADFGETHEPHQHGKPENRQNMSLGYSGRRPRHLSVDTASMFVITT